MAIGIEFLTSNLNAAYPIREDALGLARTEPAVHGASATLPTDFLLDAYFSVRSTAGLLYLSIIASTGGNTYILVFSNVVGAVQAIATIDTTGWSAAVPYEKVAVVNAANQVYGKLIIYVPSALTYLAGTASDTFQLRLPLENTVVVPRNATVETFELYTALPPVPDPDTPGPISGDVILQSGYNVGLDPEAVDDADLTNVTVSAVPQGQAPCTHEESEYVKGFMQLLPDENGNIQITNGDDECYSIMPVLNTSPAPPDYLFQIDGSCYACCSCDDYKNVATAIENLMQRSKSALAVLTDAHNGPNKYTDGVNWFNQHIAPTYMGPKVVLVGQAGAQWSNDPTVRGGSLHLATLDLFIKNNTKYSMRVTSIAWNTVAMAPQIIMLRNWSALVPDYGIVGDPWLWISQHPYRIYTGPIDSLPYPITPTTYDWIRIGGEHRHHVDVQIWYYDGPPIPWDVSVTVDGEYWDIPPIPGPGPYTPVGNFSVTVRAQFS